MTAASPPAVDGRVAKLAEDLSRVREELIEARQREELRSAEVSALQERVQAAEERAAERVGQAEQQEARLREVSTLRERVQRVEELTAADREHFDEEARKLRKEAEAERERSAEIARRLAALERDAGETRAKLEAFEANLRRAGDDLAAALQQLAQIEGAAEAAAARISANAESARRAGSDARSGLARAESTERQVREIRERVEAAAASVRQMADAAGQWQELGEQVETMRGRLDDSRRMTEDAVASAAGARRMQEGAEERIGDAERVLEQLRVRDANREREVRQVLDQLDALREEASAERERFLALQEQVRRRQIDDLEQEIRELKSYARARADV